MLGAGARGARVFILFLIMLSLLDAAPTRSASAPSRSWRKLARGAGSWRASYREAEASAQDAWSSSSRRSNIRLISYLEEKGNKAGLDDAQHQPQGRRPLDGDKIVESAVELTLTDVSCNRLVDFLARSRPGPGVVKVKYLRLEPRPRDETLTAWVTIATYHAEELTMAEIKLKPWKRALAYAAFSFFALLVAFFLTFPYDALKERITDRGRRRRLLRADRLAWGPGLFSVRATDVQVSKKATGATTTSRPRRCASTRSRSGRRCCPRASR